MKFSSLPPIALFALTIATVVRANDQQMQQAAMNAAVCLLAIGAGSTDRRSDLQANHKSLVFGCFGNLVCRADRRRARVLAGILRCRERTRRKRCDRQSQFLWWDFGDLDYGSCADQAVTVGPWTIATSFKADKFDNCTMNRSVSDLDITFLRTRDGLLLLLDFVEMEARSGQGLRCHLGGGYARNSSQGAGGKQRA